MRSGNHLAYRDDAGFTADGAHIDGGQHHAGMICIGESCGR
ncbi:Atu4866 domain-containing protein [Nitratireductor thuwali]